MKTIPALGWAVLFFLLALAAWTLGFLWAEYRLYMYAPFIEAVVCMPIVMAVWLVGLEVAAGGWIAITDSYQAAQN